MTDTTLIRTNTLTISDIERFHDGLENGADVLAYPPQGARLSLAAASELACILSQFGSASLDTAVNQNFEDCAVWSLFRRMRNRPAPRFTHDNMVLLRVPDSLSATWLCREAKLLEDRLLLHQFSKHLSRSITGAVFEMIDNVWMHSNASEPPLLCYQTARGGFSFAVTDMGIGVLRTLKRNSRFSHLRTSISALEEAVKVGVSCDPNGSGLGLPTLTRALANLWGRVRLRSGQAALTFNREQEQQKQSHQFLPEMKGFQVSAICRVRPPKLDSSHHVHYTQ